MSYEAVNIGGGPNDDTGDPLRTAFDKINRNTGALDATSYKALTTAWSGTATINSTGSYAGDLAYQALRTAWSGTAGVGQVFPIANSGTAGVNQVFPIAVAGTNLAATAYALAQQGTIAHQMVVFASTVAFNMSGSAYQSVTVTGPAHVTVSNPALIRAVTGRLVSDSAGSHALSWSAEFNSYGTSLPGMLPNGKKLLASFTSFGATLADVDVAAAVQF